jgi:hypothetical protein
MKTFAAITLQHASINEETCYGETNGANNGCSVFGNTDGVELIKEISNMKEAMVETERRNEGSKSTKEG